MNEPTRHRTALRRRLFALVVVYGVLLAGAAGVACGMAARPDVVHVDAGEEVKAVDQ